jgi:hypothetical protein
MHLRPLFYLVFFILSCFSVSCFDFSQFLKQNRITCNQFFENCRSFQRSFPSKFNKRAIISTLSFLFIQGVPFDYDNFAAHALYQSTNEIPSFPARGFQTKSGLKYFDLVVGTEGRPPRFGELVSFRYATMYRPNGETKLQLIDTSEDTVGKGCGFLNKHGNSRLIRAMDEALHTMKVGGKRRIIVPPQLGYVDIGLGPYPALPKGRKALNELINNIEAKKGELVMDIELVMIAEDENDQGYYQDIPVNPEEIRDAVRNWMENQDSLKNIESSMGLKLEKKEEMKATEP